MRRGQSLKPLKKFDIFESTRTLDPTGQLSPARPRGATMIEFTFRVGHSFLEYPSHPITIPRWCHAPLRALLADHPG